MAHEVLEDAKRAHQCYNWWLHEIAEPALGNQVTYADELSRVSRRFLKSKFRGVFPSDRIPQLTRARRYAIINTQARREGSGKHWFAVALIRPKTLLVYDPLGFSGEELPVSIWRKYPYSFTTDPDVEQRADENNCGARSLAWLLCLHEQGQRIARLI